MSHYISILLHKVTFTIRGDPYSASPVIKLIQLIVLHCFALYQNNNKKLFFLACKMITCKDYNITCFWSVKWCIVVTCVCSHNVKMTVKLKTEYGAVLHMPVLKEGKDRVSVLPGSMQGHQSYTQPGNNEMNATCYP